MNKPKGKPKGKPKDLQIDGEGRQTYGQTDNRQRRMIDEKTGKNEQTKRQTKRFTDRQRRKIDILTNRQQTETDDR